jgi:5-methylthioadenosine/S-adenosylhomocysteine deaminase
MASSRSLTIYNCDALVDGVVHQNQDIRITDGVITGVVPTSTEGFTLVPGDLDGSGLLAMPGLINGHTHAAMTMLRGAVEDVPIESWFNDHVWPIEVNVNQSDVHLGTLLACAEMIQAGVTSFADHYFHEDQAAKAVAESGMRANLGMTFFSSQGEAGLAASIAFVEEWHGKADGRITASLAPHATYTCSDDDLQAAAEAASRLGVRVHIHAAESLDQTNHTIAERGITPIAMLSETGIIEAGALIAHGCGIVESDLPLLAANAANVGVAHCPKTYMKLAINPLTPIRELREVGVAVGLGTDGPASCNSIDLFENMRLTALAQKYNTTDATWLTTTEALEMAGPESARVIDADVGRLSAGAKADVILVDLSGLHNQPVHDPLAALVYSARSTDVRTTIVDGVPLMIDRELQTIDVPALTAAVQARAPELMNFDAAQSIQTYDT